MDPAPPKFEISQISVESSASHRLLYTCKAIFLLAILFTSSKFIAIYLGDYLSEQELAPYHKIYIENQAKINAILAMKGPQGSAVGLLDPRVLTWTEATSAAPWEARDAGISFLFHDKMWLMGGLHGERVPGTEDKVLYWQMPHFNDIWSTADGLNWNLEKAHAAWPPRRSMSIVDFKGKLLMFGGYSTITDYDSEIWQSDDAVNWVKLPVKTPWPPREGQTAEVFGGKIWMMGGVNYDKRITYNDVWWSDNGTDWHEATGTAPWSSRWDHAIAVFQDKLFLSGGMDLEHHTFKDVWVTADGLNWQSANLTPPFETRQGHTLLVFKGVLWSIGRLNDEINGGINDVWFTPDGVNWTKTDTDPAWLGREDHQALVFNGKIWVFTGMDSNWHWTNDVWYSSE